ncbi:MAG: AraC family transcriptional regulator, partial [Achromobacter sp.]|nr:AraC family transcriptional regulator [Achromobacter sp.]
SAAAAAALASGADPLDTHIRALTLLSRQLRALAPPPAPGRLSQADIARLERAHALMQAQMDRELTVQYLCLATGLNEFKLKQGFRALYGDSPMRLLAAMRMRRAWELLEGGCQVAQAAYQVGYRHPANFSAAFTRFHGRAPKSVFGKRR